MNNKYKIAIIFVFLVTILGLIKLSDVNKKKTTMISTVSPTPKNPVQITPDSEGIYTISGKTGFFGFNNPAITPAIDYNDSNYVDSRPAALTTDKKSSQLDKTRTMPMTLAWAFLNPTVAANAPDLSTIPITNSDGTRKHYNYGFSKDPAGTITNIGIKPSDYIRPCYVQYNVAENKDGPIIPPLEIPLNSISFMMMFHLWMTNRYDISTIKDDLYYNSIANTNNIYEIINKADDTTYPISSDFLRLYEMHVFDAADIHDYLIQRSMSPIADDIRTKVPNGYINWRLDNPYSDGFSVLNGLDGPWFGYKGGASGTNQRFYLTYGGGYSYRQTGDGVLMTNPLQDGGIIRNNVGAQVEVNSWSGKKNDQLLYRNGGYLLWINPFFSASKYVKEFIAQDPYLQFLFFTDKFFQPDSNSSDVYTIKSSNNADGYLKQFILDLYNPTSVITFWYGINWMKNEFCNSNSGFLSEKSGNYCACQPGFKHTNEAELAIDKLYKLVKGTDQDRRCAFSTCKNISAYQPLSQVECSSFCGVVNINNAEPGSIIQDNGTYNISCGEGQKTYNYVCNPECTNSGGTCPADSADTNISTPTCTCPAGKRSTTVNNIVQCEIDPTQSNCGSECVSTGGTCYANSGCVCPTGKHIITTNGKPQCETDTPSSNCGLECTNSGGTCSSSGCVCPTGKHIITTNGKVQCETDTPPPNPSSSKTGLIVISVVGSIGIIGLIALIIVLYKRIGK